MNKLFRLLLLAAVSIAVAGISSCHTVKAHGCGCGMEEHLRTH
jgi:hypothetical protein